MRTFVSQNEAKVRAHGRPRLQSRVSVEGNHFEQLKQNKIYVCACKDVCNRLNEKEKPKGTNLFICVFILSVYSLLFSPVF